MASCLFYELPSMDQYERLSRLAIGLKPTDELSENYLDIDESFDIALWEEVLMFGVTYRLAAASRK